MVERIIIVGAGQAGFQTALSLRQKGYAGSLILLGADPHPPYERPPLSKAWLAGELDAAALAFRKPDFYAEREIDLRPATRVIAIDRGAREVLCDDGARFGYDALVLATGARARTLSCAGAETVDPHVIRDIADADRLKAASAGAGSAVVIGGGYIGLEVAAVLTRKALGVTVLEAAPRPMARTVGAATADYFAALHRAQGVDLRCGVRVASLESAESGVAVRLEDGALVKADIAVAGVGAAPETALAEAAGLPVDDGILVDAAGRSADPAIFAAGDCTRFPLMGDGPLTRLESVQNAVDQAKTVAASVLGEAARYDAVPWFWSDQFGARLQTAGLRADGDQEIIRGDPADGAFSVCYVREGRFVALDSVGRVRDFTQAKKLIAAGARPDPVRLADPDIPLKET